MNKSILLLAIVILVSGCIVSKKKYTALQSEMIRKQDSLNLIIKNNQSDFNRFLNNTQFNENYKLNSIDSLHRVISNLTTDTLNLKQSLRNTITEYEIEKNKLIQLSQELENKNNELENLKISLQNKDEELKKLQDMVENNRKQTDALLNTIQKALNSFDASELTVYQKDGKIYVSLEEKLLFKSGSVKIDPKGEEAIIKIAKVLENNPDITILIEGHTDNVGASDYNWNLSTQRALAVEKIIENNSKIDLARITVAGRGMFAPVSDNKTDEGKKKNRRIEIILMPKLDVLYQILENKQ